MDVLEHLENSLSLLVHEVQPPQSTHADYLVHFIGRALADKGHSFSILWENTMEKKILNASDCYYVCGVCTSRVFISFGCFLMAWIALVVLMTRHFSPLFLYTTSSSYRDTCMHVHISWSCTVHFNISCGNLCFVKCSVVHSSQMASTNHKFPAYATQNAPEINCTSEGYIPLVCL